MAIYHQSRSRQQLYWWDAINYTALVTDQSNIDLMVYVQLYDAMYLLYKQLSYF